MLGIYCLSRGAYDNFVLAVLISLQYRLGIFGYFATEQLSAESPTGVSGSAAEEYYNNRRVA